MKKIGKAILKGINTIVFTVLILIGMMALAALSFAFIGAFTKTSMVLLFLALAYSIGDPSPSYSFKDPLEELVREDKSK